VNGSADSPAVQCVLGFAPFVSAHTDIRATAVRAIDYIHLRRLPRGEVAVLDQGRIDVKLMSNSGSRHLASHAGKYDICTHLL
jgi:hypothetical protein